MNKINLVFTASFFLLNCSAPDIQVSSGSKKIEHDKPVSSVSNKNINPEQIYGNWKMDSVVVEGKVYRTEHFIRFNEDSTHCILWDSISECSTKDPDIQKFLIRDEYLIIKRYNKVLKSFIGDTKKHLIITLNKDKFIYKETIDMKVGTYYFSSVSKN